MEAKGEEKNGDGTKKTMSPCDVEALKKCLEENKGNHQNCRTQIEAFKAACSLKKPNSYYLSPHPNVTKSAVTEL